MNRIVLSAVFGLVALPTAYAAEPPGVSVTCIDPHCVGEAAIEGGNKTLAREQALEAAIRDALVKAAGAEIDAATETEGGTLLQDRVFMHANGYIKGYQVESDQEEEGGGVWRVEISHARVGTGDLSRDLAAVKAEVARQGHPRLYVLLREQSIETLGSTRHGNKGGDVKAKSGASVAELSQGVVAEQMTEQMSKLGWNFVDPEVASGKVHVQNALTTDLENLDGRDFSVTGADYVVLGSVIARPQANESDMFGTAVYPVDLRVVANIKATDTGLTVASVSHQLTQADLIQRKIPVNISYEDTSGKLLKLAGEEITQALQKQVLEKWRANRNGVGKVTLTVAVTDYDVLQAFEQQLQRGVANVKAVDEVSFNDGKAELAVSMAGTNPRQLAGSLSNKTVKGMQVKVTKVTTNTVEVKLVR